MLNDLRHPSRISLITRRKRSINISRVIMAVSAVSFVILFWMMGL